MADEATTTEVAETSKVVEDAAVQPATEQEQPVVATAASEPEAAALVAESKGEPEAAPAATAAVVEGAAESKSDGVDLFSVPKITDAPICVTGASGFIAGYIVQELLACGYTVHGTVRNAKDTSKFAHLLAFPGAAERLKMFSASLTDEGSYDEAVAGCEYVLHTASPFALTVNNPQADLVDPAVNGTLTVLRSCAKTPSVRRVVLTSSMAAVTDEPVTGYVLSEKDWNEQSNLSRNPYYYSKTLAERAGWEFIEKTVPKPAFDLVTLNPYIVVGPSMTSTVNPSVSIIQGLMSAWGFVHVKDVAHAHCVAMVKPEAAGRHLLAATPVHMNEVIRFMNANGYSAYKLPCTDMSGGFGSAIVKLASYMQPAGVGSYLRTHVGRNISYDNSKGKALLGRDFVTWEQCVLETAADLVKWNHVPAPKK